MAAPHHNTRRQSDDWRTRPPLSNAGHRQSPRPLDATYTSPVTSPSMPNTPNTSPANSAHNWRRRSPMTPHQPPVEPQRQPRVEQTGTASARWRSWKPDVASTSGSASARSEREHSHKADTSPGMSATPPAEASGWNGSNVASTQDKELERSKASSSMWNNDDDDGMDDDHCFPTPHMGGGATSSSTQPFFSNQRSGWSPEPPEEDHDEPATASPPSSLATVRRPSVGFQAPPPTHAYHEKYQGDGSDIIKQKFFLAPGRKESRNISIDDMLVRIIRRKRVAPPPSSASSNSQPSPLSSPPPPPPPSSATAPAAGNNVSPFFQPVFHGTPSQDYYNQYKNANTVGKQRQKDKDNSPKGNKKWAAATPSEGCTHPDDYNPDGRPAYFASYPDRKELDDKVSTGDLHRGVIRINRRNRYDAYVSVEGLDDDVYVGGDIRRNRAFDGDIVAVRLIDVSQVWKERKERRRKRGGGGGTHRSVEAPEGLELFAFDEEAAVARGDDDNDGSTPKPKYAGEVVGLLDRPEERVAVGYVRVDRGSSQYSNNYGAKPQSPHRKKLKIVFQPLDLRMPLFMIQEGNAPADLLNNEDHYTNRLLVAKILDWPIYRVRPRGKVIKVLGMVGDMEVETQAILAAAGIKNKPYPLVARDGLPKIPWTIPEDEISKRTDYRSCCAFSIDPETAKDLDDILHIKRLENGGFEVGVHIADVSYFIKPNTPLDTEARERATSTYLVNQVVAMLPDTLAEELCSLNPGKDRLAFSVVWQMDDEANVRSTWFGKTVVCSKAKLSYGQAQQVLDGGHLSASVSPANADDVCEIEASLRDLVKLARHLRKRRFANGALALQSVKLAFQFDEQGEPISVSNFQPQDSNQLIEEFMLLANIHVAKKISSTYDKEALLRRHAPPILRRLDLFLEEAEGYGYSINASSAGALQVSLAGISDGPVKDVLLMRLIKPMQRAKYYSSGSLDISQFLHYALNEPVYTHFTSPIRRYADILVHRQLHNALEGKTNSGYSTKTVQMIAYACNYRREMSKAAEEMSRHLYLARLLNRVDMQSCKTAVVMAVTERHFDVYLSEYGLQRRLYLEDYPLEEYRFDNDESSLVLYWERGIPVDMESTFKREHRGRRNRPTMSDATSEVAGRRDKGKGKERLPRPREPITSVRPAVTDLATCMQRLSVFTAVDVKLQVNSHRSPPVINMYPVNPFL